MRVAHRAALPTGPVPNPVGSADTPFDFDPGEHTIPEVVAYVAAHPDQRADQYDREAGGKARVTLLEQLED